MFCVGCRVRTVPRTAWTASRENKFVSALQERLKIGWDTNADDTREYCQIRKFEQNFSKSVLFKIDEWGILL